MVDVVDGLKEEDPCPYCHASLHDNGHGMECSDKDCGAKFAYGEDENLGEA